MLADHHLSFDNKNSLNATDTVHTNPESPSYSTANAFNGDFVGLALYEDDNIWNMNSVSPFLSSWNGKRESVFTNPETLERDMKYHQYYPPIRNAPPTPSAYYEENEHSPTTTSNMYFGQWDGVMPPDGSLDHLQAGESFSDDHSPFDPLTHAHTANFMRRKLRSSHQQKNNNDNGNESDNNNILSPCFSQSDFDDQQQEQAKREKFLERNRLAASKCRQKKKEHTTLLESRYKEQSDKKEKLVAEISRLRSEILGLKNEVLKHAQCGDEPIKLHLAQMVKKITYKDSPDGVPANAAATDATPNSEDSQLSPTGQPSLSFGFDDVLHLEAYDI